MREADLICVMRRGQVVGLGTHDELMRTCTVYQEIFYSQFKREEVEGITSSTVPSAPLASSDTKEVAENA